MRLRVAPTLKAPVLRSKWVWLTMDHVIAPLRPQPAAEQPLGLAVVAGL